MRSLFICQNTADDNRANINYRYTMDKWATQTTIKFLEKFSQLPCLWDYNDENYRKRDVREAAFTKLAEYVNIEGFDARAAEKKMQTLRGAYLNEKRKVKNSQKFGSSKNLYKPKLVWFDLADSFLKKIVKFRKSHLICDNKNCGKMTGEEIDTFNGSANEENFGQREEYALPCQQTEKESIRSATSGTYSRKGKHQNDMQHFQKAVSTLHEISHYSKTENEFEIFGRSVAKQLEGLPLEIAYELQSDIQQLISRRKIVALHNQQQGTQYLLFSPEDSMSPLTLTVDSPVNIKMEDTMSELIINN